VINEDAILLMVWLRMVATKSGSSDFSSFPKISVIKNNVFFIFQILFKNLFQMKQIGVFKQKVPLATPLYESQDSGLLFSSKC